MKRKLTFRKSKQEQGNKNNCEINEIIFKREREQQRKSVETKASFLISVKLINSSQTDQGKKQRKKLNLQYK